MTGFFSRLAVSKASASHSRQRIRWARFGFGEKRNRRLAGKRLETVTGAPLEDSDNKTYQLLRLPVYPFYRFLRSRLANGLISAVAVGHNARDDFIAGNQLRVAYAAAVG